MLRMYGIICVNKERIILIHTPLQIISVRHTNLRMLPQEGARNCEADISTESL